MIEISKKDVKVNNNKSQESTECNDIRDKYIAVDKYITVSENELNNNYDNGKSNINLVKDLNDEKYDYLFESEEFDDQE